MCGGDDGSLRSAQSIHGRCPSRCPAAPKTLLTTQRGMRVMPKTTPKRLPSALPTSSGERRSSSSIQRGALSSQQRSFGCCRRKAFCLSRRLPLMHPRYGLEHGGVEHLRAGRQRTAPHVVWMFHAININRMSSSFSAQLLPPRASCCSSVVEVIASSTTPPAPLGRATGHFLGRSALWPPSYRTPPPQRARPARSRSGSRRRTRPSRTPAASERTRARKRADTRTVA